MGISQFFLISLIGPRIHKSLIFKKPHDTIVYIEHRCNHGQEHLKNHRETVEIHPNGLVFKTII